MRHRFGRLLALLSLAMLPSLSFGQTSKGKGGASGRGGGGGMSMGGLSGGDGPGGMGGPVMPGVSEMGGVGMGALGGYGSMDGSPLALVLDGVELQATRVFPFQYQANSFRPKGGGEFGGGMGAAPPSDVQTIYVCVFDGEKVNDRTRIELAIPSANLGLAGYPGASSSGSGYPGGGASKGGAGGQGTYSSGLLLQSFASLAKANPKSNAKFTESEIQLVSDIIRQTIWKEDVIKTLRASKGNGESAPSDAKLLKQLLAEQYDTQLARQEMEAESIKQRLEVLQEEMKRRKQAKERVIEVQWGRLILDAQGLLNEQETAAR
jgi:hypothetical protein